MTLTCQQCGKSFKCDQSRRRYCGRECYYKSSLGHRNYNVHDPDPVACLVCGTEFLTGGQGRPKRGQRFCSNRCQQLGRVRRGTACKELNTYHAAYLAGLIDGEGSIMLYMRGPGLQVRVMIANTHKGVLDWTKKVTGIGGVFAMHRMSEKHKQGYGWWTNGVSATTLLKQIRPYMHIKTVQADLAMEAGARLRNPTFKAERSWQEDFRSQMKELNRRGPVAV